MRIDTVTHNETDSDNDVIVTTTTGAQLTLTPVAVEQDAIAVEYVGADGYTKAGTFWDHPVEDGGSLVTHLQEGVEFSDHTKTLYRTVLENGVLVWRKAPPDLKATWQRTNDGSITFTFDAVNFPTQLLPYALMQFEGRIKQELQKGQTE